MTSEIDNSSDEQDELAIQRLARTISLELIEQIEPSQIKVTNLVIDDLIELALQEKILPRGSVAAFNFGGLDLIAQFIVPAVVAALTARIISKWNAETQSGAHQPTDQIWLTEEQLINIVRQAKFTITSQQVRDLTRLMNMLVNRYIESEGMANYQPSPTDIESQRKRLELHRQNLKVYLDRKAIVGDAHMTTELHHGINQTRAEIRKIKDILRIWGSVVDDHTDDEPE